MVTKPSLAAKLKIRKNLAKRESKKKKTAIRRGIIMKKKPKLKNMAVLRRKL